MYPIDNNTASTTLPVPKPVGIPGFFTTGTVGGVPATIVEADFLNQVQQELLNIVAAASIAPSKSQSNQVIQAILWLIANNTRQRLTGPLSLYVSPTGSDTNNGLTPTTAFATPQAAWNYVMTRLDLGANNITVHLADGTYPPLTCIGSPVGATQGAEVIFVGDQASPSSVVLSNPNGNGACYVAGGAAIVLEYLRLQCAGTGGEYNANGTGLIVNAGGYCGIVGVDFGTCQSGHMLALAGGSISSSGSPYTISGNAPWHCHVAFSGGGLSLADSAVTIYNTPTFSTAFALAEECGSMNVWGMTFSGAAHGPRYLATSNGIIQTRGAGANYFPGDAAGSVQTGGQYL